jgi:hypothetical protein
MSKKTVNRAPKTDKDWEAENDFSTLERAEEVRSSSSRFKSARKMGMLKLKATRRALGKMSKKGIKIDI